MRSNKIFRWIWRVDGILIFLGGLGVLTLIGIAAFSALMDKFKSHNNNTVRINTEEGAKLNLKLSYGKFTKIEGANSLVAPLISEQKYSNFGYASSKEQNNQAVRNYLFLDLTNQTTHWLLPNNDILFLGEDEIPAKKQKPENAEQLPVTAIYYRIVKADSNNDGRLDQNDKMTGCDFRRERGKFYRVNYRHRRIFKRPAD